MTPVKIALVRVPSPKLVDGLTTHIEREPVDYNKALEQWHTYVNVLRTHGWTVLSVPVSDDCPDGVYIEDTLVMHRGIALITNPGANER